MFKQDPYNSVSQQIEKKYPENIEQYLIVFS